MTEQEIFDHANHYWRYYPETGELIWKTNPPYRDLVGENVGAISVDGYRKTNLRRKIISVHRIIWLMTYGKLPDKQIDHINGNRLDNRISNLRLATCQQNLRNTKAYKNNKTGIKGVQFVPSSLRYRAMININGKRTCLGHYKTKEKAAEAYRQAAMEIDPVFYRVD